MTADAAEDANGVDGSAEPISTSGVVKPTGRAGEAAAAVESSWSDCAVALRATSMLSALVPGGWTAKALGRTAGEGALVRSMVQGGTSEPHVSHSS